MKKILFISFIAASFFSGCDEKPPAAFDGDAKTEILVMWNDSYDSIPHYIPLPDAKVILASEYGTQICKTDNAGMLCLKGLPSSVYSISARKVNPLYPEQNLIASLRDIQIKSGCTYVDTLFAESIPGDGIKINEIYCGGPLNNIFFFYDQYIELYNSSDSIKYLDGKIVMRVSGNNEGKGPGADEGDDGDIDGVTYIFKFPGNAGEQNYPIDPRSFIVLASDGINHKNTVSTSIDLSNADWEFYNQYSADDIDNPNIKNLINMRSDRTVDFMINLVSDVIVLSNGNDTSWVDGIDIADVVDGIEYQSNSNTKKTLDNRVDKGFALSPPKYSGQSLQRLDPGSDSNDGTLDWEILPSPTPKYQK